VGLVGMLESSPINDYSGDGGKLTAILGCRPQKRKLKAAVRRNHREEKELPLGFRPSPVITGEPGLSRPGNQTQATKAACGCFAHPTAAGTVTPGSLGSALPGLPRREGGAFDKRSAPGCAGGVECGLEYHDPEIQACSTADAK
jgi:hypothetical protein